MLFYEWADYSLEQIVQIVEQSVLKYGFISELTDIGHHAAITRIEAISGEKLLREVSHYCGLPCTTGTIYSRLDGIDDASVRQLSDLNVR
jgi:hypothetical protein